MKSNHSAEVPATLSVDCEIKLSLFSRKHNYEETDITHTYGIIAVYIDSDGKHFKKTISDISSVKMNVEEIIKSLAENKVSYFHLEAVIEDILSEEAMI